MKKAKTPFACFVNTQRLFVKKANRVHKTQAKEFAIKIFQDNPSVRAAYEIIAIRKVPNPKNPYIII